MSLPILLAIGSSLFFGTIAVLFALWEEKRRHIYEKKIREQENMLFELSLLRKLNDHIGNNPSEQEMIQLIVSSLERFLPKANIAYILCETEHPSCHMYVKEDIGTSYLTNLRQQMIQSLNTLHKSVQEPLDEHVSGVYVNTTDRSTPQSLFHIPLTCPTDRILGVLTISSGTANAFTEEQMDTVYRIVHQTMMMLSRLTHTFTEESNKLVSMIKSLREGAFMVDPQNNILVSNKKTHELLGITKESPTLLDIMNELPGGTNFTHKLEQAMKEKVVVEEKNLHIHGKVLEMTITPVESHQNVLGAAVLFHDVTYEKSVEQMKEDFTNIMVHELRSPLTAIKASTQLIITRDDSFTSEERKKLLRLIHEQSQKLLDEVGMILDAAKLQAGLFTVQKAPGHLEKLISDAVTFYTPQAQGKYISLKSAVDPNLPSFLFDERYVALIINNLISNSMKFTEVGGTITISATTKDDTVILSVADTGIGIAKEKQHALFTKFTQIASPGSHVGTGLGLYIVKGIVDAHGGKILLDSDLGKGTRITITLPITALPTEKPLPPHITEKNLTVPQYQKPHLYS